MAEKDSNAEFSEDLENELLKTDEDKEEEGSEASTGDERDGLVSPPKDVTSSNTSVASVCTTPSPSFLVSEESLKVMIQAVMTLLNLTPQPSTSSDELKWVAIDRAYIVNQSNKTYQEAEKLDGSRNFKAWKEMLELDLQAANLLPFVQVEMAMDAVNVSPGRRKALDAQTAQLIRSTLSKRVLQSVGTYSSAFKLIEHLVEFQGSDALADMVDVHYKWSNLLFRQGFDQKRFVHDFNKIVNRFSEHEVSHSDRYLVTSFLVRLEGLKDPSKPVYYFYKQLDTEGIQKLTLQSLQSRFIALDLRDKRSKSDRAKDKKGDDKKKSDYRSTECKKGDDDRSRGDSKKRGSQAAQGTGKRARMHSPAPSTSEQNDASSSNAKTFSSKYTDEQRAKIKEMSLEEKRKSRCTKCGEYFHVAEKCPNPGRLCYSCKLYGHEAKNCPNPRDSKRN